ncbi:TPA: hypothetical protein N0F65_010445 [Lagenidium giganteum]|uniref:Ribosome biogenesis protein SLX9 n=1 Tax=Lagenidium giganteum TaxID=4803 RepID=A0AAV2YV93_9STRA|nr:TPA: hypothetical protein N0F65_010445 [Lagenidium giganteum]
MARLQKKKFRSHVAAAKPSTKAAKQTTDALGAAAVAATFGDDVDAADDEHVPVDNEQDDDDDDDTGDDALSGLSRGQRKRLKKRNAFMRKMGLVNRVVQEKASETKKKEQGAFAGLAELQASLFVSDKAAASKLTQSTNRENAKPTQKKALNGKQRQKLAVRELGHLKAVHTHPSFQGDPFAAIQMHLQNTVVQANAENVKKSAETNKENSSKSVKKKNRNKNRNSMDVE